MKFDTSALKISAHYTRDTARIDKRPTRIMNGRLRSTSKNRRRVVWETLKNRLRPRAARESPEDHRRIAKESARNRLREAPRIALEAHEDRLRTAWELHEDRLGVA